MNDSIPKIQFRFLTDLLRCSSCLQQLQVERVVMMFLPGTASCRRWVLIVSSLALTLQLVAFSCTAILYVYSNLEPHRFQLSKAIFSIIYDPEVEIKLRRRNALQFHVIIAAILQFLFVFPTVLLIIGATRKVRFLLLPWLFLVGLLQVAILVGFVLAVSYLPSDVKIMSVGIVAIEAFVIFPWWYAVIHLFALLAVEERIQFQSETPSWQYSVVRRSPSTDELSMV